MRVLFLHQGFATRKDAGSGRANDFARALVEAGHEVICLAGTFDYLTGQMPPAYRGKWVVREQVDGYEVLRTWTYEGYHRSYFHRVLSFLSFMLTSLVAGMRLRAIDVVVPCTPPFFLGISGYLLAVRHRATILYEVRDLWSEVAFQLGIVKQPLVVAMVRRLERFLYTRAARVVINSPGFTEPLVASGVPRDKIVLVPNGIDITMFRPMPEARERVRNALGLADKFIALYAGSLGKANSLDTILDAAALLQDERDIAFLLVGDGKDRAILEARAQSLGLTNVHFAGPVAKQCVPEYLAACDAGVATLLDIPLFRTVYPNKVFDYMAAARPTVLAVDGVIREVMERARGGVFVAPQDARALADGVLSLRNDPTEAQAMGERARQYVVQHFDRRAAERRMRDCITDAYGGRVRGAIPGSDASSGQAAL